MTTVIAKLPTCTLAQQMSPAALAHWKTIIGTVITVNKVRPSKELPGTPPCDSEYVWEVVDTHCKQFNPYAKRVFICRHMFEAGD